MEIAWARSSFVASFAGSESHSMPEKEATAQSLCFEVQKTVEIRLVVHCVDLVFHNLIFVTVHEV